jgi:small-conductance mechanosensitive channel
VGSTPAARTSLRAISCLTAILEKSKTRQAMKTKNWILWLLVAVFLASEVFLFSANRQKDAALVSFQAEKQRADDLQAQLDSLKNSTAGSQSAELSKLRADNQDLPRLRNQVTQLQAANQKLTQQLNTTLTAAQQQQEQLQQIASENQQARAAAQQADTDAERNACINNLRQIDAAKNQWALENNKTADAVPTATDLAPYIKLDANGNIPGCPSGGTYTIGAVGVPPTCSIPGHVLP